MYAPYPQTGTLGLGAAERVTTTAGWKTPSRELIAEFAQDQKRAPTTAEIATLKRLAKRSNDVVARASAHGPTRTDEMDWNTAQGLINFYLVNGRGPDKGDPVAPARGGPETEALIKAAVSAVPSKQSFFSKITHAPLSLIVNPADALVHKVIGDKAYYAVAKAVGGDKVEAALRAGNDLSSHSLTDLSKGSTHADLVNQSARIATVAAQEKLSPQQVSTVLAAVHPTIAQTAITELKKVAPTKVTKILEPPKRPAATGAKPAGRYAPYPFRASGVSAPPHPHPPHPHGGGGHHRPGGRPAFRGGPRGPGWWWDVPWSPTVVTTTETCRTWGDAIDMPPEMEKAARVALNVSGGRPTAIRGPDNVLYLFALENGAMTARPCAAVATGVGDWEQWKQAARDAWQDWSETVKELW